MDFSLDFSFGVVVWVGVELGYGFSKDTFVGRVDVAVMGEW